MQGRPCACSSASNGSAERPCANGRSSAGRRARRSPGARSACAAKGRADRAAAERRSPQPDARRDDAEHTSRKKSRFQRLELLHASCYSAPRRSAILPSTRLPRSRRQPVDEVRTALSGPSSLVAGRVAASWPASRPSGDARPQAAHRGLRIEQRPPAGGDEGCPDGPRPVALPRLPGAGALLRPRRPARRRVAANIGGRQSESPRRMPTGSAGRGSSPPSSGDPVGQYDARRRRIELTMGRTEAFGDVKENELRGTPVQHRSPPLVRLQARARRTAATTRRSLPPPPPIPPTNARKARADVANIYRALLLRESRADGFASLHSALADTVRKLLIAMRTNGLRALLGARGDQTCGIAARRRLVGARRRVDAGPGAKLTCSKMTPAYRRRARD